MPRKATGRRQGRPRRQWVFAEGYDPDWRVLEQMLQRVHERQDQSMPLAARGLARNSLLSQNLVPDHRTVTRIERKFLDLCDNASQILAAQQLPTTEDAIFKQALEILKCCFDCCDVSLEDRCLMMALELTYPQIHDTKRFSALVMGFLALREKVRRAKARRASHLNI